MGCGASHASNVKIQSGSNLLASCTTLQPLQRRPDSPVAVYCPPPSDFDLLETFDEDDDSDGDLNREIVRDWHMNQNRMPSKMSNHPILLEQQLSIDPSSTPAIDTNQLGVEHMSFEEACEKLDIVIDLLRSHHQLQQFSTSSQQQQAPPTSSTATAQVSSFCPWKFIRYYTFHRPNTPSNFAAKWLEKLVDNRLAAVCVNIWPTFEEKYVQEQTPKTLQAFVQPITTLWNGTSNSAKFCQQFIASAGVRIVSSTLLNPHFNVQATNAHRDDTMFCVVADGCLSILYNVLRAINQLAKPKFRRERGYEATLDYFQNCQINGIKSKSLFCLTYGANDDELGALLAISASANSYQDLDNVLLIGSLLAGLSEAVENESREGGLGVLGAEFTVIDLVDCLNRLGLNDANKRRLMRAGLVSVYKMVLSEPRQDVEIVQALKGLWTLSFNVDNFDILRTDVELLTKLKHMAGWKNRKISETATSFLWWLTYGGVQEPVEMLQKVTKFEQQVAITYHWRYRQWAQLMKSELERIGYRVWMDNEWGENRVESAFAFITEGILRSNLIVACLSTTYQESCRCRTEFEYACLLKKSFIVIQVEPDYQAQGWLEEFFRQQVPPIPPHDLSTAKGIETNLRPLLDQIRDDKKSDNGNKAPDEADEEAQFQENTSLQMFSKLQTTTGGGIGRNESQLDVSCWQEVDVQRWMDQQGFLRHKEKFDDIDGRKLLALKQTYFTMPAAYFKELKRLLVKPNLEEMLAFTNALLGL